MRSWLTAKNPDPSGFHVRAVLAFYGGDRWALRGWWRRLCYPALFWDFCSNYQAERTPEQLADFLRCLKLMNAFYATPRTLVLRQRHMDLHVCRPTFPHDPKGQPDYHHSGWCKMESAVASLARTGGGVLYDLGAGGDGGGDWVLLPADERRPPSEMAAEFADERRTKFNGKGDRETVARQYDELFEKVTHFDTHNQPRIIALADWIVGRRARLLAVLVLVAAIAAGVSLAVLATLAKGRGPPVGAVMNFAIVFAALVAVFILPAQAAQQAQARLYRRLCSSCCLCRPARRASRLRKVVPEVAPQAEGEPPDAGGDE